MGAVTRENSQSELYREVVPFLLMKFVIALMIMLAGVFLYLFVHQLTIGPVGDRPAPDWFYLIMFLVFLAVTGLVVQIRNLNILMGDESISVAYGILKYTVPWYRIDNYHVDASSGWTYGGWGFRIVRVQGKWTLAYNVTGSKQVVLELNQGRFRRLVFSTQKPEAIMDIIRQQVGR